MNRTPLTQDARDLVEAHLPLVRSVVAGVSASYPRHADRDELAQAAALGLVEAAARYDPARGVPFDRWAALRIRGAVVDAVRALDFAPRALRAAARDMDVARAQLEAELGRTPTVAETADRLGTTPARVAELQGRVHGSLVLSLDAPTGDDEGDVLTLGSSIVDEAAAGPVELLEERERATYLRDAVECLPTRLRAVVVGYFLEGRTSAEVADALGVTESRVSQMRSEALKLMRVALEAQYGEVREGDARNPEPPPASRPAPRAAAYAAAVAGRSSFAARVSVPAPRRPSEHLSAAV